MSALLRALMAQRTGGDNPNLATVTEGSVTFDAMVNNVTIDTPIRATLRNGVQYNVSFDVSVLLTQKGATNRANIAQYGTWHHPNMVDFRKAEIGVEFKVHFEKNMTTYRDRIPPKDTDIFNVSANKVAGSVRIYNVSITEV